MTEHILKTWPESFQAMKSGLKPFDLRLNDRNFQVGDTLILTEYIPDTKWFTGDYLKKMVTYILGKPFVQEGYVIMTVADVMKDETISFKFINGLNPTVKSCTLKVIEEVGELMQMIGKHSGQSGEKQTMSDEVRIRKTIFEALDVAQSAITMAHTLCRLNELSLEKFAERHEAKLIKKGYLVEK